MIEHFAEGSLVHPAALLAPSEEDVRSWVGRYSSLDSGSKDDRNDADALDDLNSEGDVVNGSSPEEEADEGFREAAE